ncbi:gp539 [Bacillus phage G]|uniref:Gp539 n=1 Tax=Bacillus phage G TaxID=2884420 RepID=G3MAS9_9CAUD|nr:gp539 [Bacillus phage G]AEO93796.1 gp539 [Bacillus phage G]
MKKNSRLKRISVFNDQLEKVLQLAKFNGVETEQYSKSESTPMSELKFLLSFQTTTDIPKLVIGMEQDIIDTIKESQNVFDNLFNEVNIKALSDEYVDRYPEGYLYNYFSEEEIEEFKKQYADQQGIDYQVSEQVDNDVDTLLMYFDAIQRANDDKLNEIVNSKGFSDAVMVVEQKGFKIDEIIKEYNYNFDEFSRLKSKNKTIETIEKAYNKVKNDDSDTYNAPETDDTDELIRGAAKLAYEKLGVDIDGYRYAFQNDLSVSKIQIIDEKTFKISM